jgi:hypothetical protein
MDLLDDPQQPPLRPDERKRRGRGARGGTGVAKPARVRKPPDLSYRVAVRAVLWFILGSVFVGFAIWWVLF